MDIIKNYYIKIKNINLEYEVTVELDKNIWKIFER